MKRIFYIVILQLFLNNFVSNVYALCTSLSCSETISKQIVTFTNQFRASNGRSNLVWNEIISSIGRAYSIRMARGIDPFGHNGFTCRVSLFPLAAQAAGENLYFTSNATSSNIARMAVDAWINSPGHRANLLGQYNYCGVGVFQNNAGVWYVTQLFALF